MSIFNTSPGNYYPTPLAMYAGQAAAADLQVYKSDTNAATFATTAAFTELARRGLENTTNWTAATPKEILSVSNNGGYFAAYVGPTAGGTETHTVSINVDGRAYSIAYSLSSGERPFLLSAYGSDGELSTTGYFAQPGTETLGAGKDFFTDLGGIGNLFIPSWRGMFLLNIPTIRFKNSFNLTATHSANITNSTATAYSGIMYRLEP